MKASVLIVEDRSGLREAYASFLKGQGYLVTQVASAEDAERVLLEREFHVILLDYMLPGMNGIDLLARVKQRDPTAVVIVMTAFGEVKLAVRAIKGGAFDFLEKPVDLEYLSIVLERATQQRSQANRSQIEDRLESEAGTIIGDSQAILAVLETVDQVAPSSTSCLLLGESGTGKELVARRIHQVSARSQEPFIAVNCSALPRDLVESELFGYEKGAFTGAQSRKPGLIELADGGTLFLDEIGDLPIELQPKLLRFIQEAEFRRVGGQKIIKADVRLVCATNRDLALAIRSGSFREDLYFRIAVFPIELPPLRDRISDIPALARFFLKRAGHPHPDLAANVVRELRNYSWPGNVRELENIVERAVILSRGSPLDPAHLPANFTSQKVATSFELDPAETVKHNLDRLHQEVERQLIQLVLRDSGGKRDRAAMRLGMSTKSLYNKIKRYGISVD